MKQHSILIMLVGGIVAICCFVTPWVTFTNGGYKKNWETDVRVEKVGDYTRRFSRPVSEQGVIIKPVPETHHRHAGYKIASNGNLTTISFIAAIVTIGCSIILLMQSRPGSLTQIVLMSSVLGVVSLLVAFLLVMFADENGIRSIGNTTYTLSGNIQFGGFGAGIGFVIAIIGAKISPRLRGDKNEESI